MKRFATLCVAAAAAGVLSGCSLFDFSKKEEPPKVSLIQPDCYTVYTFEELVPEEPPEEVKDAARAFLGKWGGGAWDGAICHDLYVLSIASNGEAVLFDAHGPGFHPDATAFTRRGMIGEDGRLRVRQGAAKVEYWIKDGRLHGERRKDNRVNRIIMTKQAL